MVLDSKSNEGDNATFCLLLTLKLCDLLVSGGHGVINMKSVCFKIASYDLQLERAWRDERNYTGMIQAHHHHNVFTVDQEHMKDRTPGSKLSAK